jgi:hypothetical protein
MSPRYRLRFGVRLRERSAASRRAFAPIAQGPNAAPRRVQASLATGPLVSAGGTNWPRATIPLRCGRGLPRPGPRSRRGFPRVGGFDAEELAWGWEGRWCPPGADRRPAGALGDEESEAAGNAVRQVLEPAPVSADRARRHRQATDDSRTSNPSHRMGGRPTVTLAFGRLASTSHASCRPRTADPVFRSTHHRRIAIHADIAYRSTFQIRPYQRIFISIQKKYSKKYQS